MNRTLFVFLIAFFVTVQFVGAQEMVSLQGGSFVMGSTKGPQNEKPAHSVYLNPFKMDRTEVTNQAYNKCVASGKCTPAHYSDGKCFIWNSKGLTKTTPPSYFKDDNRPVVCVSWKQAKAYCRSKGKKLPTEAQWEYAATNGGTHQFSIGSPTRNNVRFKSGSTAPVGSFASGYNQLSDMCGNVWEWVNDRYEANYYSYSPNKNPTGPSVGRFRVIRGGGWYSNLDQIRSKNRHWFAPEAGEVSIGFRCSK